MVIYLIIILLATGLIVNWLYFRSKWTLIYTSLHEEDYFRITSCLSENGIQFTTRATADMTGYAHRTMIDYRQVDIYVLKEDARRAEEFLRKLYYLSSEK